MGLLSHVLKIGPVVLALFGTALAAEPEVPKIPLEPHLVNDTSPDKPQKPTKLADDNGQDLALERHGQLLRVLQKMLDLHSQRISDQADSIKKMNELLDVRFSSMDALMSEYEKRIVAAEELAKRTQAVHQAFISENSQKINSMSSRQDRIDKAFQAYSSDRIADRMKALEKTVNVTLTNEIANTKLDLAHATTNTNKNSWDIADLDSRVQVSKSQIDQLWPAVNKIAMDAKKVGAASEKSTAEFKAQLRDLLETYLNLTEQDADAVFGSKKPEVSQP